MRYLTTLHVTARPETPPPAELMAEIATLGQQATLAGALVEAVGLLPMSGDDAARVTLTGGSLTVTDGPFTEAKELISYAVYDVRSRDEAVEWASRFLRLHQELWPGWEGSTDVQPVFTPPAGQTFERM